MLEIALDVLLAAAEDLISTGGKTLFDNGSSTFFDNKSSTISPSFRLSFDASPMVLHVNETNPNGRETAVVDVVFNALPVCTLTVDGRPTTRDGNSGAVDLRCGAAFADAFS